MPGADVRPAARHRDNAGPRGLLHYRVIDGDRLCGFERIRLERDESQVAPGLDHGAGDGLHAMGIELAVFIEQNRSTKHEVAAVPEIARLDISCRGCRIRLLHEVRNAADLARSNLARADIAVFGGSPLRPNTECHDLP